MRRKLLLILTIVVIFGIFTLKSNAQGYADEHINDLEELLPEQLSGITSDASALTERVGLPTLLSEIVAIIRAEGSSVLALLFLIVAFGALAALLSPLSGKLLAVSETALGVIFSLGVLRALSPVFSSAAESLSELCKFFSAAIPIFTAISVSSGAVSTASVQAVGMNFTVSLVSGALTELLLCVVGMGLSLAMLSFFGDETVTSLSKSVSGLFKWLVGISTAMIIGTMSLQSVVASASDSVAMRAAKYAASGMIPVVGGTVSGALSTLAAGLSYAKSIVGTGAVLVVITLVMSPLVLMLLYRLALSLGSSISSMLGSAAVARISGAYRSALDSLIAVYSLSACIIIFEIILFMKSGVTVL